MSASDLPAGAESDEDMLPEYDFSNAVRGKFCLRAIEGTSVVVLEPDVAEVFTDSASVNRALRLLVEIARGEAREHVLAEQKPGYTTE